MFLKEEALTDKYENQLLTKTELSILEDLVFMLEPFNELTKRLSGSKYITISMVLPCLCKLEKFLNDFETKNRHSFMEDLAKELAAELKTRISGNKKNRTNFYKNSLVRAATFLDPRFRGFKFVDSEQMKTQMLDDAQNKIKSLYKANFYKK